MKEGIRPSVINQMIDDAMVCAKCGTKGFLKCDCFEQCSCGWITDAGKPCDNPETTRCSTKVKYGTYNRKTKRYE